LDESDFDVSTLDHDVAGIVFGNQMTYRSMLESLFQAYPVDGISDFKIDKLSANVADVCTI